MARFKFKGISEYLEALEKIGPKGSQGVIRYAVYPGAAIVADAVRAAIESQATDSGKLASSISLSPMRYDKGYINTRVMFTGYDTEKPSKRFPKGVPNAVKAAVLESGNSTHPARHIISKAARMAQPAADEAMAAALDENIAEILGE